VLDHLFRRSTCPSFEIPGLTKYLTHSIIFLYISPCNVYVFQQLRKVFSVALQLNSAQPQAWLALLSFSFRDSLQFVVAHVYAFQLQLSIQGKNFFLFLDFLGSRDPCYFRHNRNHLNDRALSLEEL
jgi:hypothetical protein